MAWGRNPLLHNLYAEVEEQLLGNFVSANHQEYKAGEAWDKGMCI